MNNRTTISILILAVFALIGGFYIISNISKTEASKSSQVSFTASLIDSPRKDEETGQYFIFFDDVKATNLGNKEDLSIFKDGGILITELPADKSIKKGNKIFVTLKRNFAATNSLPPQILGDSIVKVEFK